MAGGDGGRAGFEYRDPSVAYGGHCRVGHRVGDGGGGVGAGGLYVEGGIAVGLLTDGGNRYLSCGRGDREGAFLIDKGVVVAPSAAHGDVVGARGRGCCGRAGRGGSGGEAGLGVVVDEARITQGEGRVVGSVGPGDIICRHGKCGFVYHQCRGGRGGIEVARGRLAGGDGGRAGFEYRDPSVAYGGHCRVGHRVGDGGGGVGAGGLYVEGGIAVGLLTDGGNRYLSCGRGDREGAFLIDKGVVVAPSAAHGDVVGARGRGCCGRAGGGGSGGEVGLCVAVDKARITEGEGRVAGSEGAGGVVGRDGKGCFVDGEFHGLAAGRVVFRCLLRDGQGGCTGFQRNDLAIFHAGYRGVGHGIFEGALVIVGRYRQGLFGAVGGDDVRCRDGGVHRVIDDVGVYVRGVRRVVVAFHGDGGRPVGGALGYAGTYAVGGGGDGGQ